MTHTYDWIGVGGLALDVVLRVERLPLADDKYPAALVGKLPGGFIANATCAAARLGLRTGFIGAAGDDSEGTLLRDDFAAWGVDAAGLVHVPGEPTPFTVVVTDGQGGRAILLPHSPLYDAPLTDDQLAFARQARVIYTFPHDVPWCRSLRQAADDSGGLLALDVESAIPMRGEALRDAVALADIVFVTATSLGVLDVESIGDLITDRPQWVILTAGSRGAYGLAPGLDAPVFHPARSVPVVDSTGAGDCFHAALIAAYLDGAPVAEALAFATTAAALKVQHAGARGGLPDRLAVETLLNS